MHIFVSFCRSGPPLFVVLWDAFETVILPRRVMRAYRLARLFISDHMAVLEGRRPKNPFEKGAAIFS